MTLSARGSAGSFVEGVVIALVLVFLFLWILAPATLSVIGFRVPFP